MVQRYGEYTYRQGELRGIVGEERRGKEMDRCPLTHGGLYTLPAVSSLVMLNMPSWPFSYAMGPSVVFTPWHHAGIYVLDCSTLKLGMLY
jgi:hypothetical protein